MAYYTTSQGYGTSGVKTVICGFQPTAMRLSVGAKNALDSGTSHKSVGTADGTRQNYISEYSDGVSFETRQGNNKMISHWEDVGGTLTEVLEVTFDSFTATEGKFNVTNPDGNYTLVIELWN